MSRTIIESGKAIDAFKRRNPRYADCASRVKAGKVQFVRVTFDERGVSTVVPESEWMDIGSLSSARDHRYGVVRLAN